MLFLSGCAHKNFVDAGKELMVQQQYELAVEKFTDALQEQPDNEKTQQHLAQAQHHLDRWAKSLKQSAIQAEENQQREKALILFAKVLQLTQDKQANTNYKRLYEALRRSSMLPVTLSPKSLPINESLIASTDGLYISQQPHATTLTFSQSNPIFEIQQSTKTLQTQYISGTQIVANPALVELQHALAKSQHKERNSKKKMNHISQSIRKLNNQQQRLQAKASSINSQLATSHLSDGQKNSLEQNLSSVNSSIRQIDSTLSEQRQALSSTRQWFNDQRHQSSEIAHHLAHTPATAEVPVYSDYEYPVQEQTNSLTATLYLNINNQIRPANFSVKSTDQSHQEHPIIGLDSDPMVVSNKEQLSPLLIQQRDAITQRVLNEVVDERKLGFYYQAQQAITSDKKMALLMHHALTTQKGAIAEAQQQIEKMLTLEFGQGGTFNVNQLLHYYQ